MKNLLFYVVVSTFFFGCTIEGPTMTRRIVLQNDTELDVKFEAFFTKVFEEIRDSPYKVSIPKNDLITIEYRSVAPYGSMAFSGSDSIFITFQDSLILKFTDDHTYPTLKNPITGGYTSDKTGDLLIKTFLITQEYLDSAEVIRK